MIIIGRNIVKGSKIKESFVLQKLLLSISDLHTAFLQFLYEKIGKTIFSSILTLHFIIKLLIFFILKVE